MPTLSRLVRVALVVCLPGIAWAAGTEQFSPQGEVRGVRQASARFDVDMVPLGDPRLADPFNVDCQPGPAPGTGRWVDSRNWVYDFATDLPAGQRCEFSTRAGLKDLAGTALAPARFHFSTGGPAIVVSEPEEGNEAIHERQVFILGLDAPVRTASLAGRLWCVAEGVAERIPAQLLDGDEKREVLAASQGFFRDYYYALGRNLDPLAAAPGGAQRTRLVEAATRVDTPVVVARCARRLPAGARLGLVWAAGIESVSGVATRQDQHLGFRTRPEFTAKLRCQKLNARSPCLPILPLRLNFSAGVDSKLAGRITLRHGRQVWKARLTADDLRSGVTQSVEFPGPFPEQASLRLELPRGLKDDTGRPLLNARSFPMTVKTDLAPPLARFAAGFGIYELNAQPALPLTLRYVDKLSQSHAYLSARMLATQDPLEVIAWLRRLRQKDQDTWGPAGKGKDTSEEGMVITRHGGEDSIFEPRHKIPSNPLSKPLPDRETEVIGIPLRGAGLHVVEVASPRLGKALMDKAKPYHVRSAALVTNLAIHFKLGQESSLVWVTRLDDGKPVAQAEVAVMDCAGKRHAQGKTDRDGLLRIGKALPDIDSLPGCLDQHDRQWFVTARAGEDFSFLLSDWNDGIAPWRFNLFQNGWRGPHVAHAVLDRGLYRGGEEVAMKLFVRSRKAVGFGYVDPDSLGREVILRHAGSGEEVKLPVTWDGQGIAEATYSLPREARQGMWRILVSHTRRKQGREELEAGEFRVAAFRVPTLRTRLTGPAQIVSPQEVHLDMQASWLSGGAAGGLPITLRGQLQPWPVHFEQYEQIDFANGPVRTGHREADADWGIGEHDVQVTTARDHQTQTLQTRHFSLDDGGAGRASWELPPVDSPHLLRAEAEYRDANGEIRAAAARIPVYPAQVLVGVETDTWAQGQSERRFRIHAVDTAGKPMAGVPVQGQLFQRQWFSTRKRVIGGYYAYAHTEETLALPATCQGHTDAQGLFVCTTRVHAKGTLMLQATAKDAAGRSSHAHVDFWVPEGDGWVDASDHDRMDLIPEKGRYEAGETARLRLVMPFASAQVLVGVEREGVLDAWVTQVERNDPVIQVPIRPEYGPNVFVTALTVRDRVASVQPTAMIDLGKPAFRMGATELQVGWSGYALDVQLATDKTRYHTRDKVRLRVKARRPDGSTAKGVEIALAAVDEGLLELAPNTSWQLLAAMLQRRGMQVTTSTAQMQVVGKRHYGRKAVASGGGGGSGQGGARELFDTRVFWQARIRLDDRGEAQVDIPLNDSLGRFRIVAVANVNVGRFGTGETSVTVDQDLQILSGAAPLVREGDSLKAYFTLRNASPRPLEVEVKPSLNGRALAEQYASLAPGQAREIALPVQVPAGVDRLVWDIRTQERGNPAVSDRLRIGQQVAQAVPVRTLQASLVQLDGRLTLPVQRPAGAISGRGGVDVRFQSALADNLVGVRAYMRDYPWTCLEQQASRAIALGDDDLWQRITRALPTYLDRDGLAKYWPALPQGSDSVTAYLLSISAAAGLALPTDVRLRMLGGLRDFVSGRLMRDSGVATADLAVRRLAALAALARHAGRHPEFAVRAEWLESFDINPGLWPTSALLDWIDLLARSPHLPQQAAHLREARTLLRARLHFSGTRMGFSTEAGDAWWWLMTHPDVNASRVVLTSLEDPAMPAADIGRLMRGALARQQQGRWHTTVANAWGVLAARAFSDRLERQPITGESQASLADKRLVQDWGKPAGGGLLPWTEGTQSLTLTHRGQGRPWVSVASQAAIPLQAPLASGYRITREVVPVSRRRADVWHRGDVLRVKLTVEAQTDMGWVALLDPIPAGATILGTGLGGDSSLLSADERQEGQVRPAYEERALDSFRAYFRNVPKGRFSLEYTLRLNNEGHFNLPSTRVEAIYAPELFGETPVPPMDVGP